MFLTKDQIHSMLKEINENILKKSVEKYGFLIKLILNDDWSFV